MSQNLKGVIPDKAVTVITQLGTALSSLSTRFNALAAKPLLTKPEADAQYGPPTMVKALQVSGSNPLNIAGLIGTPGFVQAGFTGTATVRNAAGSGTSSFTFVNGICTKFTP